MVEPENTQWYILSTKIGKENEVVSVLNSAGFGADAFFLVFKRIHKRTKKVVTTTRAMFPGYLFVGVPLGAPWPKLDMIAPGSCFVRSRRASYPTPVPSPVLERVRSAHLGLKDEVHDSIIKYRIGALIKYSCLGRLFEGEVFSQTNDVLKVVSFVGVGKVVASVNVESVMAS